MSDKMQIEETSQQAALVTENPPTVAEVIEFLRRYPPQSTVYGYEGEKGSMIVVDKKP